MTEDETRIRAACRAFGEAMQAMDTEAVRRLWDAGYEHLVYQPEEYERACRSWDEIVAYLDHVPGVVDTLLKK